MTLSSPPPSSHRRATASTLTSRSWSTWEAGLRDLEQAIIAVITLALQYGEVHIVTNAETGWVQLSAAKFIPAVVPLLHRVSILSARSTYEGRYPDAPLKWKSAVSTHPGLFAHNI